MASSGVWENVILPKTPTFEGVSGILYYIIFLNFCQICFLLTDVNSTVIMLTDFNQLCLILTDVIVNIFVYHYFGQMLLPSGVWPLLPCDRCYNHILWNKSIITYTRRSHVRWTGESLCYQQKIDLVEEKSNFLIYTKQDEKSTFLYLNVVLHPHISLSNLTS